MTAGACPGMPPLPNPARRLPPGACVSPISPEVLRYVQHRETRRNKACTVTSQRMPSEPAGTNSIPAASPLDGAPPQPLDARELRATFLSTREMTARLARPLSAEDAGAQSMPDASPTKWHLGHTTWFFETFVLGELEGQRPYREEFNYLFNSYYDALGARVARPLRGLITRPSLDEVNAYRRAIDERVATQLTREPDVWGSPERQAVLRRIELGIHHEQQHQELLLTDIKHLLSNNPLYPAYRADPASREAVSGPRAQPSSSLDAARPHAGGLVSVGHAGSGFAFDNEGPEHLVYLRPYALGSRLVSNGEYLEFMRDGGYARPDLWLSEGFHWRAAHDVSAPLYWHEREGELHSFTLAGLAPLDLDEPVCHVSYFEADAFARWAGARLPSEAEWEHAARDEPRLGNMLESERFHPLPARDTHTQLFGDCWEWTQSAYLAYPGFRPLPGALGEYNGKFMCNQMVLRGGSCATPSSHIRASYRNFFPAAARWQFSGIRLAKDL
jgi:ergothioneine biosynthesis protein EgtB